MKITLNETAHAAAIERLKPFKDKEGGEATAALRFLLRGMGLPEPPVVIQASEDLLRRIVREEVASGE